MTRESILHTILIGCSLALAGAGQPVGQHESNREATAMESLAAYHVHSVGIEADSLPVKCGLPALSFALQHRNELSSKLQHSLLSVLDRPVLEISILVGHFRIHFDTSASSNDTPAMLNASHKRIPGTANEYADSVAAIANYVWDFETKVLGYVPPPLDRGDGGGSEYDIYIQNLGNLYGDTTPEVQIDAPQEGQVYTTFIRVHHDFTFVNPSSNQGLPALRVTLAHEFHHAIQIGNYGYWQNDIYFYEMTSVWMEDVVYTDVNDYYQYLRSSQGHFARPDVPFTSTGLIVYSRGIWPMYIAKRFGPEVMRQCWEKVKHDRPLQAIDNALRDSASFSSFRTAFAEWSLWNHFTGFRSDPVLYYPEGANYPLIKKDAIGFTPPSRVLQGSSEDLASKYYEVVSPTDTLTLVLSNLDFASALAGLSVSHPYAYLLNTGRIDDSYKATAAGIYVKLDVSDPSNWWSWKIGKAGIEASLIAEGQPFPNPFRADGSSSVSIPVAGPAPLKGSLSVFSSSMDLVYSWSGFSTLDFDKQVFHWNGKTNDNQLASSGVYFYVLELQAGVIKGKIAVLRK